MEKVIIKSDEELKEIIRIVSAQKHRFSFVRTREKHLLIRMADKHKLYRLVREETLLDEGTYLLQQDLIKIINSSETRGRTR